MNMHATTHDDPIYTVDGIVHYCVANMPGAVPQTSTVALTNATMRYVNALANKGWKKALSEDAGLALGLNTDAGILTNEAVGVAHGIDAVTPSTRL